MFLHKIKEPTKIIDDLLSCSKKETRYNSYVRSVKSTFLAAVELLNFLKQLQIPKEASVAIFPGSK